MAYIDDLQTAINDGVNETATHGVLSFGRISANAEQYIASVGSKADNNIKGSVWISFNPNKQLWNVQGSPKAYWDDESKMGKKYFETVPTQSFEAFDDAKTKFVDVINQAIQQLG